MSLDVEREVAAFKDGLERLRTAIGAVYFGNEVVVEELLLGVLAGGHVLLEGVPGLGKTTLVKGLADALDLTFGRIQFTPDLMPGDVQGTRVLEEDENGRRRFTFQPGPMFCQVLLADEINRATPRTQSALLEAMQEGQVTLFGERHVLAEPFVVIATENPIEMEGTYPLPEAQLDRFLLKVVLPFPSPAELTAVLEATTAGPSKAEARAPILSGDDVRRMRALVREVPTSSDIVARVSALVLATHPNEGAPEEVRRYVRYGASPRGGQAVLLSAKARALIHGRLHVSNEDLEAVALAALRHRVILGYEAEAAGVAQDQIVRRALESVL
jgi:MoxR-like ATPase